MRRVTTEQESALVELSASVLKKRQEGEAKALSHTWTSGCDRGNHEYAARLFRRFGEDAEEHGRCSTVAGGGQRSRALKVVVGYQEGRSVVSHLSRKRARPRSDSRPEGEEGHRGG